MSVPRVIKLLVISDIVSLLSPSPLTPHAHRHPLQICPWCYIGQREMERALEMCSDLPLSIEIEYRPYKLHPSLKDGQFVDKREWYEQRFGKEKFEQMHNISSGRGRELGLDM